jgi:alpha-glucosidase
LPPVPYAIADKEWTPTEYRLDKTTDGYTVSSQTSGNATGLKIAVENSGRVQVSDTAGNLLRQELPPEKRGEEWIQRSQLRPEEAIYGLGERSMPLNLRLAKETTEKREGTQTPKSFRMWNYDAAGQYDAGADPMYSNRHIY